MLLGLVLACEFATKVQYFVATAVPVLAWLLICARDAKIPARKVTRELFLFSTPIVLAGASWVYVAHQASPAGPLTSGILGKNFWLQASQGPGNLAAYVLVQLQSAYITNFGLGRGLVSYWGSISWLMTPVRFINFSTTLLVFTCISVLTTTIAALMLYRQVNVLVRLFVVTVRRSRFVAAHIFGGNVLFNSYLLYMILMLGISILTDGSVVKQGQYRLPFIVAAMFVQRHMHPRC